MSDIFCSNSFYFSEKWTLVLLPLYVQPFNSCKLRSVESVPSLNDWTKYNSEVLIDYHLSAYTSAAVSRTDVSGILQLLYPYLMCQRYTSAAVSRTDLSGVYFSCCIHAWFVRGYISADVSVPDLSGVWL
jgi:hypothetical protein